MVTVVVCIIYCFHILLAFLSIDMYIMRDGRARPTLHTIYGVEFYSTCTHERYHIISKQQNEGRSTEDDGSRPIGLRRGITSADGLKLVNKPTGG